jgi:hypothetical protein
MSTLVQQRLEENLRQILSHLKTIDAALKREKEKQPTASSSSQNRRTSGSLKESKVLAALIAVSPLFTAAAVACLLCFVFDHFIWVGSFCFRSFVCVFAPFVCYLRCSFSFLLTYSSARFTESTQKPC